MRTLIVVGICLTVAAYSLDVVLISDIHYDSFYGTPQAFNPDVCSSSSLPAMGLSGCDTPRSLLNSVVGDMQSRAPSSFVFMMGDWLRHDAARLSAAEIETTFGTVASAMALLAGSMVVPAPTLQLTLGNNDFVPDYAFDTGVASHPLLSTMGSILHERGLLEAQEVPQFQACGNYNRSIAGMRLVTINTLVWSTSLTPPAVSPDPCGMINFLKDQLSTARLLRERVVIIGHIPPTINLFDSLADGVGCPSCDYLHDEYRAEYASIVFSNRDIISTQLFGHTHTFSFLAADELGVPLFIVPSVSPVFSNNPAYFTGTMNGRWEMTSLRLRFTPVGQNTWQWATDVAMALQISDLSFAQLRRASIAMLENGDVFTAFSRLHSGWKSAGESISSDCDGNCRRVVSCSMRYMGSSDVRQCAAAPAADRGVSAVVIIIIVASVIVVIASAAYVGLHFHELQKHRKEYEEVEMRL